MVAVSYGLSMYDTVPSIVLSVGTPRKLATLSARELSSTGQPPSASKSLAFIHCTVNPAGAPVLPAVMATSASTEPVSRVVTRGISSGSAAWAIETPMTHRDNPATRNLATERMEVAGSRGKTMSSMLHGQEGGALRDAMLL